ncbi:hypothetical protein CERSUDRAFT_162086 [Gelatoporia subvermispora B]|uniref:Nephrocystin 3-like N-terminal domain-containing protein n=1 Tax=Ceriporiopsis subvermispora (strain B) TaxID=914234 RepID=M2R1B1_CERS8|nr:hypothetical protein CERSUDRAFT_162086 [Gelatoporia subvermispora B]
MPQANEAQRSGRWRKRREREKAKRSDKSDALISNLITTLDTANEVLAAAPIPGAAYALPVLKSLAERISLMKANVRAKEDVISRIQALTELLISNAREVTGEIEGLAPDERERAERDARQSPALKLRIEAFIKKLEAVSTFAKEPRHVRWHERFWFAEPDAELLKDLGRKIEHAKDEFNLEGAIEIRKHVGEIVKYNREILMELRNQVQAQKQRNERAEDQETQGILDGLKPADASYTSAQFEEKSHLQPGTRSNILRNLAEWAAGTVSKPRVHVLFGRVGTGKSSIAHAFCRQVPEGHLGASFFFLRASGACSDVYRVFPTIAFQLAESICELRPHIVAAARKNREWVKQGLEHQYKSLILEPLKSLMQSSATSRPVINLVIDGVDECTNKPATLVPTLLALICRAAHEIPFLHVLIATRPEEYIMGAFRDQTYADVIILRDLQMEPDVDNDIRLFITTELCSCAAIGGFQLIVERPDAIERLTELSDGLFIFASTAIRFLIQHKYRATAIFDQFFHSRGSNAPKGLLGRLDALYMDILRSAFDDVASDQVHMQHVNAVLTCMALRREQSDYYFSPAYMTVFGIPADITMDVINSLRSVLFVEENITPTTGIRACHASFPQFLVDSGRCTNRAFCVDGPSGHALMARSLLDLLACGDPDTVRDMHGDLQPSMWLYAGVYWYDHLCDAQYTPELGRSLWSFTETHLEDWLQGRDAWVTEMFPTTLVDGCVSTRNWYQRNGPDDGLVEMLDHMIGRRARQIAAEAAQSPERFAEGAYEHIRVWATSSRTVIPYLATTFRPILLCEKWDANISDPSENHQS